MTLGVAISSWDGTARTHLYRIDDPSRNVYGQRTLCGRSTLGWEKIVEQEPLQHVDCRTCTKVLEAFGK